MRPNKGIMVNRTQLTGHNNTNNSQDDNRNMRTVGLDLAGTCTGYAVFEGRELVEPGRITAPARWESIWRARHIAEALPGLLAGADRVFLEVPSAKRFQAEREGRRAALAVYGMACGLLVAKTLEICAQTPTLRAWAVPAHWPSGHARTKGQRARIAMHLFPGWDWAADSGADAIDATCLVLHCLDSLTLQVDPGMILGAGNSYQGDLWPLTEPVLDHAGNMPKRAAK